MKKGFTLIELAIVVVVLGILIGGIVAGQSIVESAKVSKIVSDFQSYDMGIRAFQLEYDGLPGDFDEASIYWSGEIDGNDDGRMYSYNTEGIRAWRHLSLAEIIPGEYDGVMTSISPADIRPEENHPISPFSEMVYRINWGETTNAGYSQIRRGNSIYLVSTNGISKLYPKQARRIDLKIDDGHGGKGNLYGREAGCGGLGHDYFYDLDRDERRCSIQYFIDNNR
jgi:prepilin-type N-terminal cleavage/methylation domain-containing protein